jgi:hypothetical protein
MVTMPTKLLTEELNEIAMIWDPNTAKWVQGFRKDFKRQQIITPINAIAFNASVTTYKSEYFYVAPFATGLITIYVDVASTPTDIVFDIEFSPDNIFYYKYMIGPFGDLRYEDAAGDKKECLDIPILAPFMRCSATATGTDADKTFTITLKVILNG